MGLVYVDSSYYIALLMPTDEHHEIAGKVGAELDLENSQFCASQAVIFEVLAYVSRGGPGSRQRAAELVERIRGSVTTDVVATSDVFFDAALDLYRRRLDKRYSLTDCLGMVICRDRGISEVLTTDRDFEAEGFTILLT